jgi:beta-glucosidase
VAVLLSGRPLVLAEVRKYADSILMGWFPGSMGGPAIVDLLSGAVSPSGKLPVTFPRSVGQVPIFYNHKMSGRPQVEGQPTQKFLSHYLDSPNSPEFPFGFGLSYGRFEYGKVSLSSAVLTPAGSLRIVVPVANRGRMAADEVVQLYVRDLVGSVTRPVRELKGFSRVSLKPGESREVSFTLRPGDLSFTHADMTNGPEAGRFEIFVGGDSTAPKGGEFEYREK